MLHNPPKHPNPILFSFLFSFPAWWWHVHQGDGMPEHVSRGWLWYCESLVHCNVSIYPILFGYLSCMWERPASARYNYICSWLNRDGFGFRFGIGFEEEEEEEESLKVMERHMETKRSSSYKRLHITNQKDNKEKGDEKKKRKRRSWEKEKRERTAHAPMSYYLHLYLHYIFIIVLGLTQPS